MTDPFHIEGPALVSFSMGRTSGYMLWRILQAHGGALPDDVHVVTANTGAEAAESLDFWLACRIRWAVRNMVLLEFDPRAPHSTAVVGHNDASRNGEPLRAAIDTRPTQHLYNPVSRYCTGTTKQRRIEAYGREIMGWREWVSVRGLRADERDRVEAQRARYAAGPVDRQILSLPLADAGVAKAEVRAFWQASDFDLGLPYDEVSGETIGGNCEGKCPAMAKWKIVAAIRRNPTAADWCIAQEDEMERRIAAIPPRDPDASERRHRFFKDGTSFRDLKEHALSDRPIVRSNKHGGGSVDCSCTD